MSSFIYRSIEDFAKNLYSGKANSKKYGVIESKVQNVSVIETTDKMKKYQVDTIITYRGVDSKKSITFAIPQFNDTNIKKVCINVSIINKLIKFYTNRDNEVVGAAFKGIYINTNKNIVRIGSMQYSFDEILKIREMLKSGAEEAAVAIEGKEKIDTFKNFKLNHLTYEKIKLVFDYDDFDSTLMNDFTWDLLVSISKGEHRKEVSQVTPYDIKMFDYNQGLIYHLSIEYKVIKDSFWQQLAQNAGIYSSTIENSIRRYFRGNIAVLNMIQSSQDTNPLSMLTQSKKMYFLTGDLKKARVNSRFMDGILDPIRTHENTKDVNTYQEISLACDFNNENSTIEVLDLNFNPVKIKLEEYFNSQILSFECINYKKKEIHPNKNGVYKYCKRTRYYEIKDTKDIKYLRSESSLLSASTAIMPMINRNDLTRDLLQAHFNTQAIPTIGSRKPIIFTKFNKQIYQDSMTNIHSPVDGIVDAISKDESTIRVIVGKDEEGHDKYEFIDCKKYNDTKNHTVNTYIPQVKPGDTIERGQVAFAMNSFKDGELALGVPLLTTYSTFHGDEIEDGYVISRSGIKKLMHPEYMELDVKLKHGCYKLENTLFRSVGDKIEKDDVIFHYQNNSRDESLISLLGERKTVYSDVDYKLPKFSIGGKITSIKVFINETLRDESSDTEEWQKIENWNKELLKSDQEFQKNSLFYNRFPVSAENNDCDFIIRFTIEYFNEFKLSDKVVNRSSSKGVLVRIVEDEEMLKTEDGRIIEVVMPALQMASRKNTLSVNECKLTKLSQHLLKRIKNGEFNEIKDVLHVLYQEVSDDNFNVDYILKNYEDDGFLRINIEPFDTFVTDEEIDILMEKAGIPNSGKEILIDQITGRKIRTPLLVGYNEYLRLHFIAENKGSATPEIAYTKKMVMGIGHNRTLGQKLGEQETHALLASGKEDFIIASTFDKDRKDIKINADLNNLLLRINTRVIED